MATASGRGGMAKVARQAMAYSGPRTVGDDGCAQAATATTARLESISVTRPAVSKDDNDVRAQRVHETGAAHAATRRRLRAPQRVQRPLRAHPRTPTHARRRRYQVRATACAAPVVCAHLARPRTHVIAAYTSRGVRG
eukprot:4077551-Pleurochrysis_carterae.AAC.1